MTQRGWILLLLILAVSVPVAFAQAIDNSIIVDTDKSSYSKGETILVTGEVRDLYSGTPVSVIVKSPNDNIASILQTTVGADKKFSTEIDTDVSTMKVSGSYTITVQYGTENRSATTAFYFKTDSKCGSGTVFDSLTNSCILRKQSQSPSACVGCTMEEARTYAANYELVIETVYGSNNRDCEETLQGCFTPNTATVNVGGKVIFLNKDNSAHTFTSGIASDTDSIGTVFDSSLMMSGSSFEWHPTEAEEVPYFCIVHPWMTGLIVVNGDVSPPIGETDSKCGPGTVYDPTSNSCVLTSGGSSEIIADLKDEIRDLKLENRELKQKIESLEEQIVSMSIEFSDAIMTLHHWFNEQLS